MPAGPRTAAPEAICPPEPDLPGGGGGGAGRAVITWVCWECRRGPGAAAVRFCFDRQPLSS